MRSDTGDGCEGAGREKSDGPCAEGMFTMMCLDSGISYSLSTTTGRFCCAHGFRTTASYAKRLQGASLEHCRKGLPLPRFCRLSIAPEVQTRKTGVFHGDLWIRWNCAAISVSLARCRWIFRCVDRDRFRKRLAAHSLCKARSRHANDQRSLHVDIYEKIIQVLARAFDRRRR